jgi:hypothetical protein
MRNVTALPGYLLGVTGIVDITDMWHESLDSGVSGMHRDWDVFRVLSNGSSALRRRI